MTITLIAACSTDRFLSRDGKIPWHLPEDVAHFRKYCMGKWLLVGRRTWEQMAGWFRPGQTPLVVTRNIPLMVPGGYAVESIAEGIARAREAGAPECVVIGGGMTYASALPLAHAMELTTVHTRLGTGDASFPDFSMDEWEETASRHFPADTSHAPGFTIRRLQRRVPF